MTGDPSEPRSGTAAGSYAAIRDRTTALAEPLTATELALRVPGCPRWTVLDLLAHLSGAAHDIATGNLADAGSDGWTARQVEDRRGRPVAELIAEWRQAAAGMGPALESPFAGQIVMDALTHELDLCAALGEPGRPTAKDLEHALGFATRQFGKHLQKTLGLAPVLVRTEAGAWPLGLGEPALTLDLAAGDLLRSVTGRRSWEQIAGLGWPEEYRPAFTWAVFTLPDGPAEPAGTSAGR